MTCETCPGYPHGNGKKKREQCYDCKHCSCENNRKSICLLGAGLVATLGIAITALLRSEKNARDIADLAAELADFEDRIQKEIEDITPPVGTVLEIKPTDEPIGGIFYPYNGTQAETFWYQLCAGYEPPKPQPCPRPKPCIRCKACMKQLVVDLCEVGCDHRVGEDLCYCDRPDVPEECADGEIHELPNPHPGTQGTPPGCYEECDLFSLYALLDPPPPIVQGSDGNLYFQINLDDFQASDEKTSLVITGPCSATYVFCRTYDPFTGCNSFIPQFRPQPAGVCDSFPPCV